MIYNIKELVLENTALIASVIVVAIFAIVFGNIMLNTTSFGKIYINDLIQNINEINNLEGESINIITHGLINICLMIGFLYFSLLTYIPKIFNLTVIGVYMINQGMYISAVSKLLLQKNNIYCIIMICIIPTILYLIGYTFIFLNNLCLKNSPKEKAKKIVNHIYILIISASILALALVIEQLFTGNMLDICTTNFLSGK